MNAEQITLKNAGQEMILTVRTCGPVPVGKYPEVSFIGTDHAGKVWDYRMPRAAADRQLARQNLTFATIAGRMVRFSRDPNQSDPTRPYHGLTLLGEADGVDQPNGHDQSDGPPHDAVPHPADRVPQGQPVAPTAPQSDDLYLRLTQDTLARILPLYVKQGLSPTAGEIGAMVATRFIAQTSKRY